MSQRQVATVIGQVEYTPAPFRQIASIGVMVEYTPCIENPGDYGYEEKHFYLEKLQYLKDNHGSQVDLTPYQGCISTEQLVELSLLYVDEVLNTSVMSAIAFLIRPLFGL